MVSMRQHGPTTTQTTARDRAARRAAALAPTGRARRTQGANPLRPQPHRPSVRRRALETYISSCCFRLVVRRLEGEPELQRRASLGFGQGMMLLLFGCGVLAFVLVETTRTIACSLPGGRGGGAEDPGVPLAPSPRW